jgi:hypothetical protein
MSKLIVIFVITCIGFAMHLSEEEPKEKIPKSDERDYLAIVESLVSKNIPPEFSESGRIHGDKFSWDEQSRVGEAYKSSRNHKKSGDSSRASSMSEQNGMRKTWAWLLS